MDIVSKSYQSDAKNKLIEITKKLLNNKSNDRKKIVFKAPTGSGKTVMMAKYIEESVSNIEDDICFIWLSIGKGDIHKQSHHRLSTIFGGEITCDLIENALRKKKASSGDTVVLNWESVRSKNKATGEWKNIFMKNGEKINFVQYLDNTRQFCKIILIIDESHLSMDAENGQEIINIISPEIIVEVSATPKTVITQEDNDNNVGYQVTVKPEEVRNEGMIKKEIIINENIKLEDVKGDIKEFILNKALEKLNYLNLSFSKFNVKPLCLIQIPDSDKGDEILDYVINWLKKKNISIRNRNLSIWFSGIKENMEGITQIDSNIQVLIFKQAIATGWDCPRANILVKFRETKSEVFDIQTLGRIMRTPQQQHYEMEELNNGYVFTDIKTVEVKLNEYSWVKINTTQIKPDIQKNNINLPYDVFINNENIKMIGSKFDSMFFEEVERQLKIKKNGNENRQFVSRNSDMRFDYNNFKFNISLVRDKIDSKEYDNLVTNTKHFNNIEGEKVQTERELRSAFMSLLQTVAPRHFESYPKLIYQMFKNYFGYIDSENFCSIVQALFIKNFEKVLEPIIRSHINAYNKFYKDNYDKDSKVESHTFSLPIFKMYQSNGLIEVNCNKYAFDRYYVSNRKPKSTESIFENYLESNQNIIWWYKNEDSGIRNFSIVYEYEGKNHNFYPDYIIKDKFGIIHIYETKSTSDRDKNTKTPAKAKVLQEYIEKYASQGMNIIGGIIALNNKEILINRSKDFNLDIGDTTKWKPIKI